MSTTREELAALYRDYARVPVLQQAADGKRLVPGAGPVPSPLFILGEAPGAEEEQRGEPFVGPAGQLLRRMLADAGIRWELCYRANVLPWRPPGNRTPYPFQVTASMSRVRGEIAVVSPQVVIAAGRTAWDCLTGGESGPFADARGKWLPGDSRPWLLLAVFHPSALLHARGAERDRMRQETAMAFRSILTGPRDGR